MNKPLTVVRRGGISFTAWPGKNSWTWNLRKVYKSQETGQFVETKTFFPNEAEKVIDGLQELLQTMKDGKPVDKPMQIDPIFDDNDDIPF